VDLLAGQAEIFDRRDVLVWNIPLALSAMSLDLPPLLRGVVLVGEAALGLALDFEGARLPAE